MTDTADPLAPIRKRFLLRLADQRTQLERLSASAEGNPEIIDIVHKIAGIAGSLGFPELSQAASQTEMLLVREGAADLPGSGQFEFLMERIDAALESRWA